MEIRSVPSVKDWRLAFTCTRCHTEAVAGPEDLEADDFTISGYHFAGTAQVARRLYVTCPTCERLYFLSAEESAGVPWSLRSAAQPRPVRNSAPGVVGVG